MAPVYARAAGPAEAPQAVSIAPVPPLQTSPRGLRAEDRVHEARTARAIGLRDDVRRARGRADWWLAFEESRYAADLDTTQRHELTGDRPPVGGQAGPAWGGGGGGGGGAAGS